MTNKGLSTAFLIAALASGSISIVPILPLVLVGGGVYFLATAFLRDKGLRVSGPAKWYIAYILVSFAYASLIGVEVLDFSLYRREFKFFIPFGAFLVFSSLSYSQTAEKAIRSGLLAIAAANLALLLVSPALALTDIVQPLYADRGDIWTSYGPGWVYLGPFLSHTAGGGWFATAALVMLGISTVPELSSRDRSLFRGASVMFLILLAATFSRAYLLGTLVVLSHTQIRRVFGSLYRRLVFLAVIPAVLLLAPYLGGRISSNSLVTLSDATSTADYNVLTRYVLWGKALENFVASPFIGVGVTRFDDELTVIATFPGEVDAIFEVDAEPQYFRAPFVRVNTGASQAHTDQQAHNMYLHALGEGGLMMFMLLMGVALGTVRWLRRVTTTSTGFRAGLAKGLMWATYCVLVASFFGNSFLTVIPMFFLLSLAGYLNSSYAEANRPA